MPDPVRLRRTLEQAARLFRETPGRRGRCLRLEDVDEVLVAGDMHGHVENFRAILQRADLGKHPRRHLVLQELVHGPFSYPMGGDKSHQLLDLLAALKCQYPKQVHMLLGNHELSEWTQRAITKADQDLNALFRQGVEAAYGNQANDIYAGYCELFAAVSLAIRTPNRIFLSHSLPRRALLESFDPTILELDEHDEKDWSPGGTLFALVWGRDTAADTARAFLAKVDAELLITGHIALENGFEAPNEFQLILDSLGSPAAYCLFPTDRPLTHAELLACVAML